MKYIFIILICFLGVCSYGQVQKVQRSTFGTQVDSSIAPGKNLIIPVFRSFAQMSAYNILDSSGRLVFIRDSNAVFVRTNQHTWRKLAYASGGSTPGGNQYSIQLNDGSGGFAGDDLFTYNYLTGDITTNNIGQVYLIPEGRVIINSLNEPVGYSNLMLPGLTPATPKRQGTAIGINDSGEVVKLFTLPSPDTTFTGVIDVVVDTINNTICVITAGGQTCYPLNGDVTIVGDTAICFTNSQGTTCLPSRHDTLTVLGGNDSTTIDGNLLCVYPHDDPGVGTCILINNSGGVSNIVLSLDSLEYNAIDSNGTFLFSFPTLLRNLFAGSGLYISDTTISGNPYTAIYNTGWLRNPISITSTDGIGTSNSQSMRFYTNNVNNLTLDSIGRLRLVYNNNTTNNDAIAILNNADGRPAFSVSTSSGGANLYLNAINTGFGEPFRIVKANGMDSIVDGAFQKGVIQFYDYIKINSTNPLGDAFIVSQNNTPIINAKAAFNGGGVIIGADTTPINSAMLAVNSTSKGFLLPRMTSSQRTSISSPANGLLVYDTDSSSLFQWASSQWQNLYNAGGGSNWSLVGNAGTTAGTNFIGTTDNVPLMLKVNNIQSGLIDPGNNNTSYGWKSLLNQVAGNEENVAIGQESQESSIDGYANTSLGWKALEGNVSGNNNTAIGHESLVSVTGDYNTGIGQTSGYNLTTGSNNTFLGANSGTNNPAMEAGTAVGFNSIANFDNTLILGDTINTKIGIGTTDPKVKFQVTGDGTVSAAFMNGKVGIGITTPTATIHITAPDTAALKISSQLSNTVLATDSALVIGTDGNIKKAAKTAAPIATSGSYQPSITSVANLDAVSISRCLYSRTDSTAEVSGEITFDPTTGGGTLSRARFTLPITSDLNASWQCDGVAYIGVVASVALGGVITADTTNNQAELNFPSNFTTSQTCKFKLTYYIR